MSNILNKGLKVVITYYQKDVIIDQIMCSSSFLVEGNLLRAYKDEADYIAVRGHWHNPFTAPKISMDVWVTRDKHGNPTLFKVSQTVPTKRNRAKHPTKQVLWTSATDELLSYHTKTYLADIGALQS